MPDITISITDQQAQRGQVAIEGTFGPGVTSQQAVKMILRNFVLAYEEGVQAQADAQARDITRESEVDW